MNLCSANAETVNNDQISADLTAFLINFLMSRQLCGFQRLEMNITLQRNTHPLPVVDNLILRVTCKR